MNVLVRVEPSVLSDSDVGFGVRERTVHEIIVPTTDAQLDGLRALCLGMMAAPAIAYVHDQMVSIQYPIVITIGTVGEITDEIMEMIKASIRTVFAPSATAV